MDTIGADILGFFACLGAFVGIGMIYGIENGLISWAIFAFLYAIVVRVTNEGW